MRRSQLSGHLLPSRRRYIRRQRRKKIIRGILAVAILAGITYYFGLHEYVLDTDQTQPRAEAFATATNVVGDSVAAARLPLAVEEAAPVDPEPDAALTAVWEEGEAVELRGELAQDESVYLALKDRNLSDRAIHLTVTAMSKEFEFRKSRPGDEWFAAVDAEGNVTRFEYETDPENVWQTVRQTDGTYVTEKKVVEVDIEKEAAAGTIRTSLWEAFEESGAKPALSQGYIDLFAYTIDFATETQPGDEFAIIYEKVYLDGEFLRYGKILAAQYVGQAGNYRGFYYKTGEDSEGYYNEKGENLQRQFLKSPLATTRITSRFGRRHHPVLKRMKMHAGVDYGAPTGTPVQAVADGKIIHAGRAGAAGKLVKIRHSDGYVTLYAHLSRIAKGIRRGKRVSKKTVIGKVGSTGRSTGPHLHFGMKKHGRHINPLKVDFARAEPLKGNDKETFIETVAEPMGERLDVVAKTVAPGPRIRPRQLPSVDPAE